MGLDVNRRANTETGLYLALTEALVPPPDPALSFDARRAVVLESALFVREQIQALPPQLLMLMTIGLTGFRLLVRLRHVRSFADLPLDRRREILEWWAYGPFSLTRGLFRAIRSTALLAYYEHPLVTGPPDEAGTS